MADQNNVDIFFDSGKIASIKHTNPIGFIWKWKSGNIMNHSIDNFDTSPGDAKRSFAGVSVSAKPRFFSDVSVSSGQMSMCCHSFCCCCCWSPIAITVLSWPVCKFTGCVHSRFFSCCPVSMWTGKRPNQHPDFFQKNWCGHFFALKPDFSGDKTF